MIKRIKQILHGLRWAWRFENPLSILLQRKIGKTCSLEVLVHRGSQIVVDRIGSDRHVVTDVILDGMYDSFLERASRDRTGFRYMNLGANIGTFDIRVFQMLASKVPAIHGIAVEMNPVTYARLTLNLDLNGLYSVRPLNAAAWDSRGEVNIDPAGSDTGQRCENSRDGWAVPMLPWTELMATAAQGNQIDLVKIDIEGAEERVIPCITVEEAARIRFLVVETHGRTARTVTSRHLLGKGFALLSEEPGSGETHLSFWRGPAR